MASKEAQARLERRSGGSIKEGEERVLAGRREVLNDVKLRAEWVKWESSRQQELDDQQEAERIAIAEIDWQDFVVVSTVEFTEGDEAGLVELPPPMSINEVENMTIAQKKMAAMIMEGREDELEENADKDEQEEEMEVEEIEEESATATIAEKVRAVEIRTADSSAPMKIRKDYVPKCRLFT
jgi:splicing factor 3A subunit 1